MSERKTRSDKKEISDQDLKYIRKMGGLGQPIKWIAAMLDMSKASFERRMAEDPKISEALEKGRAEMVGAVAETAFQMAMSGKHPNMTMFVLKCRANWKESVDFEVDKNISITISKNGEKNEEESN